MNELAGKRALVTGGSRGIGAAIALALAAKGADVAIGYEQRLDLAEAVVDQVKAAGRNCVAIQANSANPAAVRHLVVEAVSALGGLDIVVNNAGIARAGLVKDINLDHVNAMLDVNIRGAIVLAQAAIPYLGVGGRVIFIGSSLADRIVSPDVTVYAVTKSAQIALTRGLARELGSRDITVNLVQPGATDTDMNPADSAHADELRAMTPLGRYGMPADVAAAVAFLASPAARQITGSTMTVDGGLNA